jgi:O-antigen/teichoic acid export membrane protein
MNRHTILRNAASGVAARLVGMIITVFITPFLIRKLGEGTYGLWVLVFSFIGYFGMSDFGLRTAVGRFVALHQAKDEHDEMNRVVVTSLVMLTFTSAIILTITVAGSLWFSNVFGLNPQQISTARILILLIGGSLALSLPLDVFDGVLVAYQRFDWINTLDIIATVLRAVLTVGLLLAGYGVVALAWTHLALQVAVSAVKIPLACKVFPQLQLAARYWSKSMIVKMYGFSSWVFVAFLWGQLVTKSDDLVVGWALNTEAVAVYSIAGRLVQYALLGSAAFSNVLAPIATSLHARSELSEQRRLLLQGTKAALLYAGFVAVVFFVFGRELICFWLGSKFNESAPILFVLTVPMIGLIAHSIGLQILFASARLKWAALLYLADAAANFVLSVILVRRWGMIGVAYGTCITTSLTMFILIPLYICHGLQLSFWKYLRDTYWPSFLAILPVATLFLVIKQLWAPTSLIALAVLLMVAFLIYFSVVYRVFFSRKDTAVFPSQKYNRSR